MLPHPALFERAEAALVAHAIGDAMGAPAENLSPATITQRWGRIEGFVDDDPTSTDDTEYGLFSAQLLVRHGLDLTSEHVATAWLRDIASQSAGFAGAGFSEMATIENLRGGLLPPASAHHAHAWSDGAAMRAVPFGIRAAGDPALAADLAEVDARVSHGREGIAGARAVAAGVAAALGPALAVDAAPGRVRVVTEAAIAAAGDTWTGAAIRDAVAVAAAAEDVWAAIEPLHDALVLPQYYWADLAPEAVGFAFGLYAAAVGDPRLSILGAVNAGRDADTIAAMAGGLAGATSGFGGIPDEWRRIAGTATGACIEAVAGWSVRDAARALADARLADDEDPARPPTSGLRAAVVAPTETVAPSATTTDDRRRGALLGLAFGEATSWTAMMAPAHALPDWRRGMFDEIRDAEVSHGVLRPVVPFTMNEPSDRLWPRAGEVTEWAVWAARRRHHSPDAVADAWHAVADAGARGSYGTIVALHHLRRGLRPPTTGAHNPHGFDDAAALRAVGIAATAPTVGEALARTDVDSHATACDDGVEAALAVAAAIATALRTDDVDDLVDVVADTATEGSWLRRAVDQAVAIGRASDDAVDGALRLADGVPSYLYSHAVAAPETVALALGLVIAADGDPRAAVPAAAMLPRFAPGVPALAGALCGALRGAESLPPRWRRQVDVLAGVAIPELAGARIHEVV